MPATAAGKLSQGELTEGTLFDYAGVTPHPLIDIGANLADPSFDQVLPLSVFCLTQNMLTQSKRISMHAVSCKCAIGLSSSHDVPCTATCAIPTQQA